MKKILAAAMAATMGLGMATAVVAPASSQVVIFGTSGDQYDKNERKAERIENRGDRKAAQAAANGNYKKAAKIQAQSERKADRVAGRDDDNGGFGIVIPVN